MKELRFLSAVEVRASTDSDGRPVIVGVAARYGKKSKPIQTARGAFREIIAGPKTFQRTLSEGRNNVCLNCEHDNSRIIGSLRAANLTLDHDNAEGLRIRCYPDMRVSYAADAYHQVQNGNTRAMSFAFAANASNPDAEDWDDDDPEEFEGRRYALRTLQDVDLYDTALCFEGAYGDAWCDARSAFPEGVPQLVETRSAGGFFIPKAGGIFVPKEVSEFEARRLRMQRLRSSL